MNGFLFWFSPIRQVIPSSQTHSRTAPCSSTALVCSIEPLSRPFQVSAARCLFDQSFSWANTIFPTLPERGLIATFFAMRILSGIQPSGALHVGNYFGMMRPAIELQDKGEAFYFIANYHSMTSLFDAAERRQQIGRASCRERV